MNHITPAPARAAAAGMPSRDGGSARARYRLCGANACFRPVRRHPLREPFGNRLTAPSRRRYNHIYISTAD